MNNLFADEKDIFSRALFFAAEKETLFY